MARTQSLDYEDKRKAMQEASCKLFAARSFHAAGISDIAKACGISKSNLYHYFESKEQILFEILHAHALDLIELTMSIVQDRDLTAREKLRTFARTLIRVNVKDRDKHVLILTSLDALPVKQRKEIASLLRQPIEVWFDILCEINPELEGKTELHFPSAMMFIGMINWTHTWYSARGAIGSEVYADLICDTFIDGFAKASL